MPLAYVCMGMHACYCKCKVYIGTRVCEYECMCIFELELLCVRVCVSKSAHKSESARLFICDHHPKDLDNNASACIPN